MVCRLDKVKDEPVRVGKREDTENDQQLDRKSLGRERLLGLPASSHVERPLGARRKLSRLDKELRSSAR
jgi:hypothetical protein